MFFIFVGSIWKMENNIRINFLFVFGLFMVIFVSCDLILKEKNIVEIVVYFDIKVVGVMRNVMWKGELGFCINFDIILDKNGFYGFGFVSYLLGELLINDG